MERTFFIGKSPRGSSTALPESRTGGRELSERILTTIATANETLERTAAKLIRLAELAYGVRDYDRLKAITDALLSVPFAAAQRAGTYYQAVTLKRAGELGKAADLLAALHAPRALLTLGTIEESRGNFAEATRYHVEAMRASRSRDAFTFAGAAMQLATLQAIEGDHAGSLHAFQSIGPLVRAVAITSPYLYPAWCNALAVELAEVGRGNEARAVIAVALASPIAERYPEIAETAREIAQAQPTRVAVVVVEPQQEDAETTEAAPVTINVHSEPPRRHRFTYSTRARTLLNPRASPRAPPSVF